MTKNVKDEFGNRMKKYENVETGRRFIPLLPIYARIDGKCFSKFTRGMNRPFDVNMTNCMIETTRKLVEKTNALVGYTQSDEISLMWYSDSIESQVFFDGRIQKIVSVLAGMATSYFTTEALKHWPTKVENSNPVFDARVVQMPNKEEVANMFLWRERDCTKNAVSMAAHNMFSHNELQGVSSSGMQEMMWQKDKTNFNDFPSFFKRGTFIQRKTVYKTLPDDVLAKIPEKYRTNEPIERREISAIEMPPFNKVVNRVGVLFDGENPITI